METVCRENGLLSRRVVIGGLQRLLTWSRLALFSCALVLILHFQPPQRPDKDNKAGEYISSMQGERSNRVVDFLTLSLSFDFVFVCEV